MIIATKQELLTAIAAGYSLDIGENGTLKTQNWWNKILGWFYSSVMPQAATELYKSQLQVAMARIISDEAVAAAGPQNLEYPLPLRGYDAQRSRLIIAEAMIEHAVRKDLAGQPEGIQLGAVKYLQGKRRRTLLNNNDSPDYPSIQAFVHEELQALQADQGNPLGVIACGYTLNKDDLEPQRHYLEESIRRAVKETWDDGHQDQFTEKGLYQIFLGDAKRDRPIIQGQQVDPGNPDADFAANSYGEILTSEIREPSMVAVTGICMSQTILKAVAELVMGAIPPDGPPPVNPFVEPGTPFGSIIANVSGGSAETRDPRMVMNHDSQSVTIKLNFDIGLTDVTEAPVLQQNVGNFLATVVIPKYQFPLPLNSMPDIKVTDIQVIREKGFTGEYDDSPV